eukprot:TRINITY_DN3224_c0_g3_i1.p1 TRINITY_DN3224_c0_g3~~TRINITY_DN3224_c0_g3_i1.p1  ORF type:complete len:359 (-),score=53.97 TRINITY_DN3224_c0_g3_i1:98-1174(-)
MPWADYKRLQQIGSGSFGNCFLVEKRGDNGKSKHLVIKEIDLSGLNKDQRSAADMEVKVLSSLRHPYIVRYHEGFHHSSTLCIVMDYCEGGDLWQYICQSKKRGALLPESQVVRWFTQLSLALKYMHEKSVLHRDIKSQNVFINKHEAGSLGCVKIADFGISKVLGEGPQAFARTMVGTPYYLSPEMCQAYPYAQPSDVWALGCVLFELCALQVPFEAKEVVQLVEKIVNQNPPKMPSAYSRDVANLYLDMLHRDASRRPTAAAILQRPFIQAEIKQMLRDNGKDKDRENAGEEVRQREHSRPPGVPPRQPLGEHNGHPPVSARNRGPSKAPSRAPSPAKGTAMEVLRPRSRAPSPRP